LEGIGVELEYMIVREDSLDVLPVADQVLRLMAGEYVSEVEVGDLCWSNELVLHVVELKTNGPAASLEGLSSCFQESVSRINLFLRSIGGRLMPTGMHPWMDPDRETRLWPHEHSPVYAAYDRIFGCRGHGWSNLQSIHLNLSFATDEEFSKLHAAIRLLLPIMPALAASSPILDGRVTGIMDNRLAAYSTNASRIPSVSGRIIPEPVFDPQGYKETILERMYRDIAPFDPDETLQHEWLNSRGAIPRFDRNTVEIRVLDSQECPLADLSVCWIVVEAIRAMIEELWIAQESQQAWETEALEAVFQAAVRDGEAALIENPAYLGAFGLPPGRPRSAGRLWLHILDCVSRRTRAPAFLLETTAAILEEGTLSRRIVRSLSQPAGRDAIRAAYRELCACLEEGRLYGAAR